MGWAGHPRLVFLDFLMKGNWPMMQLKYGRLARTALLSGIASLALVTAVMAQTPPADHSAHHPGAAEQSAAPADQPAAPNGQPAPAGQTAKGNMAEGKGMMSGEMMQGMSCGMMERGMAAFSEDQLARLRTDLKITHTQEPRFSAFANSLRAGGKSMETMGKGMQGPEGEPLPDRIGRHAELMTTHLDAIKRIQAASAHLYGALSSEQKTTLDRAFKGMGMM